MISLPNISNTKKLFSLVGLIGATAVVLLTPTSAHAAINSLSYSNTCYPAGLSHGDVILQVKYSYDTSTGRVRPLQGDASINIYNQTDSNIGINLVQDEGINSGSTSYVWASWSGYQGNIYPILKGAVGKFRVGRHLTTDSNGHVVWANESYPPGWHIQPNTDAAVLGTAYLRGTVGAAAWLAHGGANPGQIHIEGLYGGGNSWFECQVQMIPQ